jgi:hypothetical protein
MVLTAAVAASPMALVAQEGPERPQPRFSQENHHRHAPGFDTYGRPLLGIDTHSISLEQAGGPWVLEAVQVMRVRYASTRM